MDNQLSSAQRGQILVDRDGWRLCTSSECDTAYFKGDVVFAVRQVNACPFHKSEDPDRLVCFCFGHSVAALTADLDAHGVSTIREAIKAACKAGTDDCERHNPHGRCCLGHVGQVIKRASSAPDGGDDTP